MLENEKDDITGLLIYLQCTVYMFINRECSSALLYRTSKSMHIQCTCIQFVRTGLTHNEDLVYAIDGEEVTDQVKISALQSL